MKRRLLSVWGVILLAATAVWSQAPGMQYKIEFHPEKGDVTLLDRDSEGRQGLFVKVNFTIIRESDQPDEPGMTYKVVVEEDGKFVTEVDVPRPTPSDDLSVVLSMDISGSMNDFGRIGQARVAARTFLTNLPAKADCGLILFNHKVQVRVPPSQQREPLQRQIENTPPRGGTAYLDATSQAVAMLAPIQNKERAAVVLTDGVDLNSDDTLDMVIAKAKAAKVKVYTVGIGEPGRGDPVTIALVLDKSGSMEEPASDQDKRAKIEAMRAAATHFVHAVGSQRRCTIIEFSDAVQSLSQFTNNRFALKGHISNIKTGGETAVFDAIYEGVCTLEAERPVGRKAVVAMTDGIDNKSRRRVAEVIARAKEASVPLFLLGFGRKGEIDEQTMMLMAKETKGKYYHAENEQALIELFENLGGFIFDDGIDEKTLTELARKTGGQYYHARKVENLRFILEQVTQSIQRKSHEIVFKSERQVRDGTARRVTLKLVRRGGEVVSNVVGGSYEALQGRGDVVQSTGTRVQVQGVVIAEMNALTYLFFLVIIGVLIALPSLLWRRRAA